LGWGSHGFFRRSQEGFVGPSIDGITAKSILLEWRGPKEDRVNRPILP
jgi:hypothetical protein